ncbi:MAG TPA: NADH-quinone oxidoreductase subunit NuoH [Chloroflexota bacterium]|nr:NADH-quinone oxidoreductase subunit NuoH [Chloroflexota bacterium]
MPDTALSAIRSAILILLLLTGMAYMTWFERRVISRLQVRVGPDRVGVAGLLQPLADAVKLFFKEDVRPRRADRFLFPLAPAISLFAALAAFAVIPIGHSVNVAGSSMPLGIAQLNVGLLYLVGVSSLGVYGLILGGWASGSKYSLLGGLRAAAQVVSYELVLGLALVTVAVVSGSISLDGIVSSQSRFLPNVLLQPVAFVLYIIAAVAETNRAPFDLPEADTELVAGYHTEYGGMRFAMFFIAEYVNVITVSALAATMFFSGWAGPWLPGPLWLIIKMVFFLFLFVWLRATLPRLRYDQLMRLSWSVLLPLSLLNLLITGVAVAAIG